MIKPEHYQRILFALFFICYSPKSYSQVVIFQDVYLIGQLEVDNFPTTTASIEGSLNIFSSQPQSEITDLTPLYNLKSIKGSLVIHYCDSLKNLNGLENLIKVGGSLEIENNNSLKNLDGLNNITFIGYNLDIKNNFLLTNLNGLSNIDSVGGDVIVENNPLLVNLDGLNKIHSVLGNLYVSFVSALTNIDGLSNIVSIGGELGIYYNLSLTNLDGISNIISVGANLNIFNNNSLNSFCGLHLLLSSNGLEGLYNVKDNFLNPTQQEIINAGPCKTTSVVLEDKPKTLNEYSLQQNFPNPFNPETTINYQISKSGFVSLIVFDVLGKEAMYLVNEYKSRGKHEVVFDGNKLVSGIYFYKISINDFTEIKRMTLVK